MNYIISLLLWSGNYTLAVFDKKKKIIFCALIIFMGYIFSHNLYRADASNYINVFQMYVKEPLLAPRFKMEYGYQCLVWLISRFTMDSRIMFGTVFLLGQFFIWRTVKYFQINSNFVIGLYFIYPFFLDVVNIRNYLAMTIIIYSFRYLVEKKKLKFIFWVILASSIHLTAWLYLPFLIIDKIKIGRKEMVYFTGVCMTAAFFIRFLGVFSSIPIVRVTKIADYLVNRGTGFGFLIAWFCQGMNFIFLIRLTNKIRKYSSLSEIEERTVYLVRKINVYMIILLPMYMINILFERLHRNIFILNYIVFYIFYKRQEKESKRLYLALFILLAIFNLWISCTFCNPVSFHTIINWGN